ncbi:MAG: 4-hydroxy-3-methylbut-2-enyl diphosphate reductase [Lachnospiraceae bacterium]|nr:4-hydroxy-3-methylbut-2-enyl diphosphate reductase [Lachnospiraceae bacterium]
MEVILANHAGFCFGVKRAVEGVYELIEQGKNIYTFGPIIHNEEVVKDLENRGVKVIDSVDELAMLKNETVVVRAHGIPKKIYKIMEDNSINCIDLTCPFVTRIHNIVSEAYEKGNNIIVIGDKDHPEVVGIMGAIDGEAHAVKDKNEISDLSLDKNIPVTIVSQTTFNINKFQELVEIIKNKGYNVNVVDTICNATKERQESAGEIASNVDVMLVIGSRTSSNTQKLFEICNSKCPHTYYIQTKDDLNFDFPKTASLVGITAGASTPNKIIEEVQNYVRINF